MWRTLRDALLAAGVLLILLAGLAALPFIVLLLIILAVGWIVYAVIHDRRVSLEDAKRDEEERRDDAG